MAEKENTSLPFSFEVAKIFSMAIEDATDNKDEFVTPEHLLFQMLFNRKVVEILEHFDVDVAEMRQELREYLEKYIPKSSKNGRVVPSEYLNMCLLDAANNVFGSQRTRVEVSDLIVAIYDLGDKSYSSNLLKSNKIKRLDLLNAISHGGFSENEKQEPEENTETTAEKAEKSPSVLEFCTTDLTEKAEHGELDPVIGREEVINRTIQILLRRKKCNPVHVGMPGVGKTAITEGLAQKIARNEVPKQLQGYRILALNLSRILSECRFAGDFERTMNNFISALQKEEKLIVFIDEIHNIVGAGSGGNSSIDASDMLKPLLSEGKIKFIGATTDSEYRKLFEKDAALSRRFQKINVAEPSKEETFLILKNIAGKYESFHKVKYTDEALRSAVELSSLHITDRFLPDKAIDLIDEAGAACNMQTKKIKVVKPEHIEKVTAFITGKKEKAVNSDGMKQLKGLETALSTEIFGQNEAISEIVRAIKKSYAGFKNPEKPVASFLFVGSTGVGKTELARVLADKMQMPLIRFDMSEYQEKHTVSKLFGAPPGYVGYEEGGQLTEAIRKQPTAVLLLDEIEKAHADIYNSLLQIMDYATLTDNSGRKANFKNVIIIMTSNAGSKDAAKKQSGFGTRSENVSAFKDAVKNTFMPEFLNRLDHIVYFSTITPETVKKIVKKNVSALANRLAAKNIGLSISESAAAHLAELGFSKEFGARETARVVDKELENLLLDEILFGKFRNGGKIRIDFKDGKLCLF
ncbi:AAA family ATPase [bacterium]|nr:AAA family ATPase [bacterium]